eukprot:7838841-Pyramimonas_sp.AAC.1
MNLPGYSSTTWLGHGAKSTRRRNRMKRSSRRRRPNNAIPDKLFPFRTKHFDLSPSPPIYMGNPPMRGDCVPHNTDCASDLPGRCVP